jgi:hypothetical protein
MSRNIISTLIYSAIIVIAIVLGRFIWEAVPVTAYRMVTVFIVLIILSNCFAKLFLIHVYKQKP